MTNTILRLRTEAPFVTCVPQDCSLARRQLTSLTMTLCGIRMTGSGIRCRSAVCKGAAIPTPTRDQGRALGSKQDRLLCLNFKRTQKDVMKSRINWVRFVKKYFGFPPVRLIFDGLSLEVDGRATSWRGAMVA